MLVLLCGRINATFNPIYFDTAAIFMRWDPSFRHGFHAPEYARPKSKKYLSITRNPQVHQMSGKGFPAIVSVLENSPGKMDHNSEECRMISMVVVSTSP